MTANFLAGWWWGVVLSLAGLLVALAIDGPSVRAAEPRTGSVLQRETRRSSAPETLPKPTAKPTAKSSANTTSKSIAPTTIEKSPVKTAAPARQMRSVPQPQLVYEEATDAYLMDDGCDTDCCRPSCFWGDVEYLMWWRRGQSLPPLVTTSTPNTAQTAAGILGLNSTSVLYGNDDVGNGARPGGRFSLGVWCDDSQCWGMGGRAFFLGQSNTRFDFSDSDNTIIARPFFNVSDNQTAAQDALLVAYPGVRTGSISVLTSSQVLGGDAFLRRQIYRDCGARVDLVFGYQFARIAEDLSIQSSTNAQDLGAQLDVRDVFRTRNEFHGGTVGLMYQVDQGCWQWNGLAKIGFGNMHETATLQGSQTITAGQTVTDDVGLLVQSTNRGFRTRDQFVVSPELNLSLTYKLNDCWDLSGGYSFLLYSHVLQPGGTIDRDLAVNLADPPTGTQRPTNSLNDNAYWLHGVNIGVVRRF